MTCDFDQNDVVFSKIYKSPCTDTEKTNITKSRRGQYMLQKVIWGREGRKYILYRASRNP